MYTVSFLEHRSHEASGTAMRPRYDMRIARCIAAAVAARTSASVTT